MYQMAEDSKTEVYPVKGGGSARSPKYGARANKIKKTITRKNGSRRV